MPETDAGDDSLYAEQAKAHSSEPGVARLARRPVLADSRSLAHVAEHPQDVSGAQGGSGAGSEHQAVLLPVPARRLRPHCRPWP